MQNKVHQKINLATIRLSRFKQNGFDYIRIDFPFDDKLIHSVKKIEGASWNKSNRCWLVPNKQDNLKAIQTVFKGLAWIDSKALFASRHKKDQKNKYRKPAINLNPTAKQAIIDFEKFMVAKRYSVNTIKNYISLLTIFLSGFPAKNPEEISNEDMIEYANEFIVKSGYSINYHRQMVSAVKLFFSIQLKRKVELELLIRPKKEDKLPKFLSREEILKILLATRNKKHKLIILLLFGCGLRKSEIPNISLSDIRRDVNLIQIRDAKGRKDRLVPLPVKILSLMELYYKEEKPKKYLFEGQTGGKYSAESVYQVVKHAGEKAGLMRPISPHMLRHSYGTQQTEQGINTLTLQKIMGHRSSKTTEIYSHISQKQIGNTSSPVDNLDIGI